MSSTGVVNGPPPAVARPGPWISLDDAASWTGWSTRRFKDLIAAGDLTVLRVGPRTLRVSEREVAQACGREIPGPRERALGEIREAETPKAKPRQTHHWVYFLYSADDCLLYVGITNNGVARLIQHGSEKDWWPKVDHVQIEHFPSREEALKREAHLINDRRPPWNLHIPSPPREVPT